MTATAHALVGGAIAASIPNPAIGLPLIALSHPVLDMIPHWDFGWGWKKKAKTTLFLQAIFDLLLGLALAYFIFGRGMDLTYFLAAVFVSEVWDLAECPYWFLNWRFPPFSWIYNIQSKMQGRAKDMTTGILTQVASVLFLTLALRFMR